MNRTRGLVLGLIVAILIVGGWLLWSGKLGIDISQYFAADRSGPISVPPPDTITSSDGNVTVGVSKRYGGAIVYYADRRLSGNEQSAGNIIDHSNGGTLLTTAIWHLPSDRGEQELCYENQRLEDGTCPGSLPHHNPTQGGFFGDGHYGNPNPTTVRKSGGKLYSSYRGVNYNYAYNPVKPMIEENRDEWQTDFWGDLEISFHPEVPDVVVVETTITYCKDGNEYCSVKNVVTQDNQLSTLFGAGPHHPDPRFRGPYDRVVYQGDSGSVYLGPAATAVHLGDSTGASENWTAMLQANGTGIGLSVKDYRTTVPSRFGYTYASFPSIAAIQPELNRFEHDGITRKNEVVIDGRRYDDIPRYEFEPGGWYRFTTYFATGDLEKIRRDLLFVESGIREDNAPPIGFFDDMSCEFGGGWALDPDSESTPVTILFYDGPREDDDRNLIDQVQADLQRADVGAHAFHWNTPKQLKDGKEHRVYAYAVSNESSDSYQLPQTDTSTEPPPAFTCSEAVESGTPEPGHTIRLISPNGGEAWVKGETQRIIWESTWPADTDMKIWISREDDPLNPGTGTAIWLPGSSDDQSIPVKNTGYYDLTIPVGDPLACGNNTCEPTGSSSRAQVSIERAANERKYEHVDFDWSDGYFSIVEPITPGPTPESTPVPESVRGDADGDGDVDIFDYSAVVSNFGLTGPVGDTDGDGDVDIFDYSAVVSNFGAGQ